MLITTDARIERDNLLVNLLINSQDKEYVVFTHEWAYKGIARTKFRMLIKILSLCNCKFVN